MPFEPTRRAFLAGVGAVAAGAVLPARAMAADTPAGPVYRTAGDLIQGVLPVSTRDI